jgi:WD40 repeat protein/serine/threonine protein kinase
MTVHSRRPARATDSELAGAVEDYLARLQAGEPVDPVGFAARYPEHAGSLRELLPALDVLADLGSSATARSSHGLPAEETFGHGSGTLGDYRLIREVGRGGMGVVYEAEQISLRRRVALKVLPFASALDPKQLQRFKNESLAAAHLSHPAIVPVHAVGCERGVHYYAMRFIDGQPLSSLIEELRRLEGRDGEATVRPEWDAEAPAMARALTSGRLGATSPGPDGDQITAVYDQDGSSPSAVPSAPSTSRTGPSSAGTSTRSRAFFEVAARLGKEAAEALDHAHEQGILHRDVKPSNLLVDARGQIWVADFGLARLQGDAGLTMTGDLLGTLRYMSPEQALAQRVGIDHRTDIYSLGVTLYELLTLEPAYAGRDRQEVLRRIAMDEPRPLRRLNSSIPVDLETIVLKAMAKDPAGRYATAQELADDLDRFLKCEPIRARRSGPTERLMMWARRRPAIAGLVCLVALVGTAGFGASTAQWVRAERARRAEIQTNAKLIETNATLEKSLYYNRIALADRELAVNNLRRVDQILAECPPELRGWEWNYLKRARAGYLPVVCRAGTQVVDVAFSPDGRRLATAQLDGTAVIWDAATGKALHVLRGAGKDVRGVAFSPDGWRIASNSFGATMIWDATTGQLIDTLETTGYGWSVGFSPDGRLIASACFKEGEGRGLMIWDATIRRLVRAVHHPDGFKLLAFSPDGMRLAASRDKDDVTIIEVGTGKLLGTLPGHTGGSHRPAYSPDGRYLAVASGALRTENHGCVKIWDVEANRLVRTLEGHTKVAWGVAYSPDGRRLASGGFDHKVKVWDAGTGQEALTLHGHKATVPGVAFSPDGRRLASASEDGTVLIWDASPITAPPPRELLTLGGHSDEVRAVAFSPDGKRLVSAGDDTTVRLWDAASGRPVRTFRGHDHPVSGVAFSPDGRQLVSADHDGWTRLWDVETGSVIPVPPESYTGMIMDIVYR